MGFVRFADFLDDVLSYLDNVVIAALIFVVAVVLADILAKSIVAITEGAKFAYAHITGEIVRWSIWIFAILAILHQLGIAPPLIETLFAGLIGVLVISLGLAFGLGGKDVAAEILQDLRKRLKR